MRITIYQYEEAPLMLEEIEDISLANGAELTIQSREGRMTFDIADVMRVEIDDGKR